MSERASVRKDKPALLPSRRRPPEKCYVIFDVTARTRARVAPNTARGPDGDLLAAHEPVLQRPRKISAHDTLSAARAAYFSLPTPANCYIQYQERF